MCMEYEPTHLVAKAKEKQDQEVLKEGNEDERHADQDPEDKRTYSV